MIENTKSDSVPKDNTNLPEDWKLLDFESSILKTKVKVEEIPVSKYKKTGKYRIIDQSKKFIAGYWDNEEEVYEGELPVIIFGDHTRIFKYIDFPFVCGAQGTKVLKPNKKILNPLYYYYALSQLKILNRGYNRHYSLLRKKKIPLPPLPEQRNIAFILSTVQEAIEKTEAVIQATQELKKSLMDHIFTYGPVPITKREQIQLKETEIGEIPEEWKIKEVNEICSRIIDCPHTTPKFIEDGVLSIRNFNIRNGILDLSEKFYTSEEEYNERTKRGTPQSGDILFSREAPIGEACLVPENMKLSLGQRTMFLRPIPDLLDGYFFVQSIYDKDIRKEMLSKGRGVTAKHLNVADVRKLPVPLPAIEVQKKIANILKILEHKIIVEQTKQNALEIIFKTFLEQLMTGYIRTNNLHSNDLEIAS